MKSLIFTYLILCTGSIFSNGKNLTDINQIRKEFNLAIVNEQKATKLYYNLSQLNPETNTLHYAYWGATEALLAKHAFNPFFKLNYINNALKKLNTAIEINKMNIEIRYMRFSVESNIPTYLNYNKHINEDKEIILNTLSTTKINAVNCEMIRVFAKGLYGSNFCNKVERILLSNIITACNEAKLNND